MYFTFKKLAALCALVVIAPLSIYSQTIVYVDATALGSKTGTSWANAFTHLTDAVAAAPVAAEIWIAQTAGNGYSVTKTNVKSNCINITKNVRVDHLPGAISKKL